MTTSKIWVQSGGAIFQTSPTTPVEIKPGVYNVLYSDKLGHYLSYSYEKYKMPPKIYGSDDKFAQRVVKSFGAGDKNLGVLLNGLKGAGKTVTAKIICNLLNLPVLCVSEPHQNLPIFISNLDFDCVIFIDEYEKVMAHDERGLLLSCMDGAQVPKNKILWLMTTNTLNINENLLNRPSRIRYMKTYADLDKETILAIVKDSIVDEKFTQDVVDTVSGFDMITIDLVKELINEVNVHCEPASKFISIFNCNKSNSRYQGFSYKLVNADTEEVLYEKVKLDAYLSVHAQKGRWFTDMESHRYLCLITETTSETSAKMKITNPEYMKWADACDDDVKAPEEYLNLNVRYEELKNKHWAFAY